MTHRPSLEQRASGVLLHVTSLPGPHGIGDLGPQAHEFVQFLSHASQAWWQMFPLGHPGMGNSPYTSISAHAGNPLLVSLDYLREDGLLTPDELRGDGDRNPGRVDFERAWAFKLPRLRRAYERFCERSRDRTKFDHFCKKNAAWLDDYALYSALKDEMRGSAWTQWPADLRRRKPSALRQAADDLGREIGFYQFIQFEFDQHWERLRDACRHKGIGLIGDLPIFVAHDSADVWANPDLFYLDGTGNPTFVAGTPPDYFSSTGQRWGNPLYRWNVMKKDGYAWWVTRFKSLFERFDAARLDHFIGFQRCWRIPAKDATAAHGVFMPGPRDHFFQAILRKLGKLELIAEDLGLVTPEVKALRDRFAFPGMRVLQFAFGTDPEAGNYLPYSFPHNCLVYTGTHDNDTTVGWFHDNGSHGGTRNRDEIRRERENVLRYVGTDGREIHWDLIRLAFQSVANTAIIPAQDLLGLGSDARMNTPGTGEGNWEWRFRKGDFDSRVVDRLLSMTEIYGRKSKVKGN